MTIVDPDVLSPDASPPTRIRNPNPGPLSKVVTTRAHLLVLQQSLDNTNSGP